jgi:two-component system, OmpR family, copper resistance phosphate regulon response regulator CusR
MSVGGLSGSRTAPGILLVDHESHIRSSIGRALEEAGYATTCASSGEDAVRLASKGEFGLVILDLDTPGVDGRAALTRLLRADPDLVVLALSCVDDARTKAACLDLGAHDYLTKPFALEELLARVRVGLRGDRPHQVLRSGELRLDVGRMQADTGRGPIALTRLEFLLLRELMEHADQAVPKDRLLASVWGYQVPGSNVVDVCVGRLRSKLGYKRIKTVRGAGYQLVS